MCFRTYAKIQVLCLALLLVSGANALADAGAMGVNSAAGVDLPIGAGGQVAVVMGGGAAVPLGNVDFLNKVGVNTSAPLYPLDVNGAINASEYYVTGVNLPLGTSSMTTINNLDTLSPCPSGYVLTKNAANSFQCVSSSLGDSSISDGAGNAGWSTTTADCPEGSVVVGIIVNNGGTCGHSCDGDGPIIRTIQLHCRALH